MKKFIGTFNIIFGSLANSYVEIYANSVKDAVRAFHERYMEAGQVHPEGILDTSIFSDGCKDVIQADKEVD